jgi:Cu/Ag efflux pump CusA
MAAGMMPIAVGFGTADPSFRSPMAIAVIGGLVTSTVLSLLVVPAVFEFMDDFEEWMRRRVHGLREGLRRLRAKARSRPAG